MVGSGVSRLTLPTTGAVPIFFLARFIYGEKPYSSVPKKDPAAFGGRVCFDYETVSLMLVPFVLLIVPMGTREVVHYRSSGDHETAD